MEESTQFFTTLVIESAPIQQPVAIPTSNNVPTMPVANPTAPVANPSAPTQQPSASPTTNDDPTMPVADPTAPVANPTTSPTTVTNNVPTMPVADPTTSPTTVSRLTAPTSTPSAPSNIRTVPIVEGPDMMILISGMGHDPLPLVLNVEGPTTETQFTTIMFKIGEDDTGTLLGNLRLSPGGDLDFITFDERSGGEYLIASTAATAMGRLDALSQFFMAGGLLFESNTDVVGEFPQGICVTATTVDTAGKSNHFFVQKT